MSISREAAKEIVAMLEEASALCNESLRVVKCNEGLGQVQVYGRLAGLFLGNSYTNLLAPLWKQFPELESPQMKEPYVEPVATLTPESQAAIAAFAISAKRALSKATEVMALTSANEHLPFGGIGEVESAATAIEEFLAKPRFRDE
jgi:hypothetical protein